MQVTFTHLCLPCLVSLYGFFKWYWRVTIIIHANLNVSIMTRFTHYADIRDQCRSAWRVPVAVTTFSIIRRVYYTGELTSTKLNLCDVTRSDICIRQLCDSSKITACASTPLAECRPDGDENIETLSDSRHLRGTGVHMRS